MYTVQRQHYCMVVVQSSGMQGGRGLHKTLANPNAFPDKLPKMHINYTQMSLQSSAPLKLPISIWISLLLPIDCKSEKFTKVLHSLKYVCECALFNGNSHWFVLMHLLVTVISLLPISCIKLPGLKMYWCDKRQRIVLNHRL